MKIAYGINWIMTLQKVTVICDARDENFAVSLFISLHNTLMAILFPFTRLQDIGILIRSCVTFDLYLCVRMWVLVSV